MVPGSATTRAGNVTSENPVTVVIGNFPSGGSVTISWEVVADSGDSLTTQATFTCTQTGAIVSDDPDTGTLVADDCRYGVVALPDGGLAYAAETEVVVLRPG